MKLLKVTINNFRNINHAEYELDKVNIFAGPNRKGKTNTILAIYWAITGYLLDGSSDHASFKPLDDTSKEVSVELEFDKIKIKKVYFENWVKTRGSDTTTMQGHITEFYINDIKMKNSDAIEEIKKAFNVDHELNTSKFDLLQATINPYYLAKVEWKELRKFIISLIGDVSNEDIFKSNEMLEPIRERLEKDNYDTSKTLKYFNSKAKESKDTIKEIEGKIKGLEDIKNVNDDDFNIAKAMIEKADEQIYAIKNNDDSSNKKEIAKANDELIKLQAEYQASVKTDKEELEKINAEANQIINEKEEEIKKIGLQIKETEKKLRDAEFEYVTVTQKLDIAKSNVSATEVKKDRLAQEYIDLVNIQIIEPVANTEETKCPNCNYVLNQADIDLANAKAKEQYQKQLKQKDMQIADITVRGKKEKERLEQFSLEVESLEKQVQPLINKIKKLRVELNRQKENQLAWKLKADTWHRKIVYSNTSTKTSNLIIEIEKKQNEIKLLSATDTSTNQDKAVKIAEINLSKEQYQKVINDRNTYLSAQELVKKNQKELAEIGNQQMIYEQQSLLVNEFILTKLQMINKHVSQVFGDRVKFTLVETNIKEGSWNEVCYPSVLDKDTPFLNGSGSEQILTGIYLIECIKKKLNIGEGLYIFDECDKLDTESLANIDTESQLISTRVDDVNYKTVTLEKRGK